MKKFLIICSVIILGSIVGLAQNGTDEDYSKEDGNFWNKAERQCYNETKSYEEFKRCVKNGGLPICPKFNFRCREKGDIDRDFPLKHEPIYKEFPIEPIIDWEKYRELPNEFPNYFDGNTQQ